MPQDEKGQNRAGPRKISRLAERDFSDLELVRRRVQDAMIASGPQEGMFVVLDPHAASMALATLTRILNGCGLSGKD